MINAAYEATKSAVDAAAQPTWVRKLDLLCTKVEQWLRLMAPEVVPRLGVEPPAMTGVGFEATGVHADVASTAASDADADAATG